MKKTQIADNCNVKKFLKASLFSCALLLFGVAKAQVADGEFSMGAPEAFAGVWERDDRYVLFSTSVQKPQGQNESRREGAAILLKTFYGWHLDRSAEPEEYKSPRTVNDSTCPEAERIFIEYRPLVTSKKSAQDASVWEIFVWHPKLKEASVIPVAIIGSNLYLNFAVKLNSDPEESADDGLDAREEKDPMEGFWCKMAGADGVKLCPSVFDQDIYSSYITSDAVYTIRYWRTDMEYTNAKAFFSDGGKTFSVVKHIQSAGKIYTCANGRSVTIRNVQKTNDRPQVYELDGAAEICGLGEPYLKRVQDKGTEEAVVALEKGSASKRAPNPDPPFAPSNLDWHMDDINRLEAGNKIIEAVRSRQREFAQKYPGREIF